MTSLESYRDFQDRKTNQDTARTKKKVKRLSRRKTSMITAMTKAKDTKVVMVESRV
jgi:hypothetical protein